MNIFVLEILVRFLWRFATDAFYIADSTEEFVCHFILNEYEVYHLHIKFSGDTRNTYAEDLICTNSTGSISTRLSDTQNQEGYISTGWEDTRLMFCSQGGKVGLRVAGAVVW